MVKNTRRELDRLRLPDLQERFRETIGEETRCPNRTFLIRRIVEAVAAGTTAAIPPQAAIADSAVAEAAAPAKLARVAAPAKPQTARPARGRFQSMTVDELQIAYVSIVGRPTGSTDRRYLVWKIREAEKGRVPVGPRETRTPDQEAASDTRILPLRLDAPRVAAIDAVWRAQGLKSRMEFFRRALGHYLAHTGAHAAAAMFAAP